MLVVCKVLDTCYCSVNCSTHITLYGHMYITHYTQREHPDLMMMMMIIIIIDVAIQADRNVTLKKVKIGKFIYRHTMNVECMIIR